MKEFAQLDFFEDAPQANLGRVVKTVDTNLGMFGNRTDLIIVDQGSVRGASLLECDDPNIEYYNNQSADPKD